MSIVHFLWLVARSLTNDVFLSATAPPPYHSRTSDVAEHTRNEVAPVSQSVTPT